MTAIRPARWISIITLTGVLALGAAWAAASMKMSMYEQNIDTGCGHYHDAVSAAQDGDKQGYTKALSLARSMGEPLAEYPSHAGEVHRWIAGIGALERVGASSTPRDADVNQLDAICAAHDSWFWGM